MHQRSGALLNSGWFISIISLAAIGVIVLLLWNPFSQRSHAGKTIVFECAAGMKKPVERIIRQYEAEFGATVKPTYGGSGAMLEKLKLHGGDLFLSADSFHMNMALKDGTIKETIPIATLRPAMVVHKKTQAALTATGKPIAALRDVLREDFKLLMANPTTTAVGRLTKELFEKHSLWDAVEKRRTSSNKVVWLATVNQVAQEATIRDDGIGFIWDATAHQFEDLAIVPLPEVKDLLENMVIGVAAKSKDPAAALHFARYLTSRDKGLPIFTEYHFDAVADADVWENQPRIRLYAGTMLQDGLRPVLQEFETREGVRIETKYNGCGILVADMETVRGTRNFPGMYVSCDLTFAERVKSDFDAAQEILQNDLVFLVQRGNPKKIKPELLELQRTDLKMGMPHPEKSAMGKIFADLLVTRKIEPATITYFNSGHGLITQMLAGALDLAIVGRSNASNSAESREKLEILDIAGPILTQTIQVARDSSQKHLLERLRGAMTSPESLARFKQLGFRTP